MREAVMIEVPTGTKPVPYIADLSPNGRLVIGWDTPLEVPPSITGGRLAFRRSQQSFTRDQEYDLYNRETTQLTVWNKETMLEEVLTVVDALSIKVSEEGGEIITRVDWKLKDFKKDTIELDLLFEDADRLSQTGDQAILSVTFWDVDPFTTIKGEKVRRGTSLNWVLKHQASEDVRDSVDNLDVFFSFYVLMVMVQVPYCIKSGRYQASAMFFNSV